MSNQQNGTSRPLANGVPIRPVVAVAAVVVVTVGYHWCRLSELACTQISCGQTAHLAAVVSEAENI